MVSTRAVPDVTDGILERVILARRSSALLHVATARGTAAAPLVAAMRTGPVGTLATRARPTSAPLATPTRWCERVEKPLHWVSSASSTTRFATLTRSVLRIAIVAVRAQAGGEEVSWAGVWASGEARL